MANVSSEDFKDSGTHIVGSRAKVFTPEASVVDQDTGELTVEGSDRRKFTYAGKLVASPNNRNADTPQKCQYGGVHHTGNATNVVRPSGQDPMAVCPLHLKVHLKNYPHDFHETLNDHKAYKAEYADLKANGTFRTEKWIHSNVGSDAAWTTSKKSTKGPGRPLNELDDEGEKVQSIPAPIPPKAHIRAAHNAMAHAVAEGGQNGPDFNAYLRHAIVLGGLSEPEAKAAAIHGAKSYERQQGITSIIAPQRNMEITDRVTDARRGGTSEDRDSTFREAAGLMEDTGTSTARETKKYRGSDSE